MQGVSRTGLAALLVCVLVLTGTLLTRPVIPSAPTPPWRWLAPWRIQTVEAAGEELNPYVWAMELIILGVVAKEALESLNDLAADYLADYLRDLWDAYYGDKSSTSPAGGGGGAELWP